MGLEGQDIKIMNSIGYTLGHLFQIQDDYLDLYRRRVRVGKLIGGDILESKKTFLYITVFEHATQNKKKI